MQHTHVLKKKGSSYCLELISQELAALFRQRQTHEGTAKITENGCLRAWARMGSVGMKWFGELFFNKVGLMMLV